MGGTQPPVNLSAVNGTDSNNGEANTSSDDSTAANMSDDEICAALGLGKVSKWHKRHVSNASYIICLAAKQWPWEWVGNYPPKEWTVTMVASLSKVLERVAWHDSGSSGPGCKRTVEDVKDFIQAPANLPGSGRPLGQSDINEALWYFTVRGKRPNPAATDNNTGPCVGRSVEPQEAADQNNEEVDQEHVDDSTAESTQHNHTGDTNGERDWDNDGQASKGSKGTASPVSSSNSPSRVAIPEQLVKQMNSTQFKEVSTLNHNHSPPLASSKKRAHTEETSLGLAIAAPDRPAQKRCLDTNKSMADPELAVTPLKDTAEAMTKEQELATLDTVVSRRLARSMGEVLDLRQKVYALRGQLKNQKASLEHGTVVTQESQFEVQLWEGVRRDATNNLHRLRQTINHYQANESLLEPSILKRAN